MIVLPSTLLLKFAAGIGWMAHTFTVCRGGPNGYATQQQTEIKQRYGRLQSLGTGTITRSWRWAL